MYLNVIFLDCIYKTNKYKCPLLNIVGLTATNLSLDTGFYFLDNEYNRELNEFKFFINYNNEQIIFIADRELALLNSVKEIFPNSKIHLCIWHINRNITKNCLKHFQEDGWK